MTEVDEAVSEMQELTDIGWGRGHVFWWRGGRCGAEDGHEFGFGDADLADAELVGGEGLEVAVGGDEFFGGEGFGEGGDLGGEGLEGP